MLSLNFHLQNRKGDDEKVLCKHVIETAVLCPFCLHGDSDYSVAASTNRPHLNSRYFMQMLPIVLHIILIFFIVHHQIFCDSYWFKLIT